MAKKDEVNVKENVPMDEEKIVTEDSTIEHINNLIANSDEKEDFVVEEEASSYEPTENKATKNVSEPKTEERSVKKNIEKTEKSPVKHAQKKSAKPAVKSEIKAVPKTTVKINPIKKNVSKSKFSKISKPVKKIERGTGAKMVKPHKSEKKTEKSSNTVWIWVGLAVVFLIIVAFILFRANPVKQVSNATTDAVAATVNGEAIYMKDIDRQYSALNPAQQAIYTKDAILNKSIDEVLLIQESKKMNIKVSGQEIKDEIDNFKKQNKLTDATLNDLLTQQGMTLNDLQLLIEKRIRVRDLLNETILSNITVTDNEIQQYYDNNTAKFADPEKVTVSHILIIPKENVSLDQAKVLAMKINSTLNATNFCDMVVKYTDDSGSKNTCGTYTFGRGEMVAEFENASFNMKINTTAIVETIYGWHLIKKLDYTPPKQSPLSDVKDQIYQTLHDMIAQTNFDALQSRLRSSATIVNYLASSNANDVSLNGDTANAAVEDSGSVNTSTVIPAPVLMNLDNFTKCLTNHNVVFYGASWCQDCSKQKELFGDSSQYLRYVDCAVQGQPQIQTQECNNANITGYPTWKVNGALYPGSQTLEKLSALTGCDLQAS